jgi:hypothetical protein
VERGDARRRSKGRRKGVRGGKRRYKGARGGGRRMRCKEAREAREARGYGMGITWFSFFSSVMSLLMRK